MIAKAKTGRGFRGALEYDLQEGKSVLLDTNLAGENIRAMAHEFGEVRQLRPNLGKAVFHASISAAPGEHLTDNQWLEIAHRYLDGMGFTDNQYVISRHTDTDHEHIHLVINRIQFSGDVVNDFQYKRRQEEIMRTIERDYGLTPVAPSREAERKAPTQGELAYWERTGEHSIKIRLQDFCDEAIQECRTVSEYVAWLEGVEVDVIPTVQLQGAKLSGLMYRLDGTLMKGSDLGKGYSPVGLAKQGVTYEQDRDYEAVRACREREARREYDATNQGIGPSETPERGGAGRDAGTLGSSDGRLDGRNAGDVGPTPGARRTTDGRVSDAEPEHREYVASQHPTDGRRRGESEHSDPQLHQGPDGRGEPSRVAARVETLRSDGDRRDSGRDADTRIVALALTSGDPGYPALQAERDRTAQAVQRQLQAFGVDRVEIGIRDEFQGKMMNRLWTPDDVLKNVAWLKRMNAKGNNILVQPAGEHGLVLVDDLTPDAIGRLKGQGFDPTVVTETSPGNFQAWLKLSREAVDPAIRKVVAQDVARDFGGDPNSAAAQHYGRLAGFTNQKPDRLLENGLHPFVGLREWSGQVMAKAHTVIDQADRFLDQHATLREREKRIKAIHTEGVKKPSPWGRKTTLDSIAEYTRQWVELEKRYGPDMDKSRADWTIATRMVGSGQYDADDVERAILGRSPNLHTRKPGHLEDYAHRTATKAWLDPNAQAQRDQNLAQHQDRGYER